MGKGKEMESGKLTQLAIDTAALPFTTISLSRALLVLLCSATCLLYCTTIRSK